MSTSNACWWQLNNREDENDDSMVVNRQDVDDDFDWRTRDTGVSSQKESYFVEWCHYNRTALNDATSAAHHHQQQRPFLVPWTKGRLWKQLQQDNDEDMSFTLHNWFEESAIGHWAGGKDQLRRFQIGDDNTKNIFFEQIHTFLKTPRRVTHLPMRLPRHWPDEADTSRVTLCGRGVVSGPRFLPNDAEQSAELLQGDGDEFQRMEFAELWLIVNDKHKIGLFVAYHGCTGELQQFFVMRQVRVPDPQYEFESLDAAQEMLTQKKVWPVLIENNAAAKAFSAQAKVDDFVQHRHWKGRRGVANVISSPAGPAVRLEATGPLPSYHRPIPTDEEHELYYDIRFPDGMFCLIPKTLHPTHLAEDVCIELGCVREEEGLQRILVCGKRSRGLLDTCVYEEWGPTHPTKSS